MNQDSGKLATQYHGSVLDPGLIMAGSDSSNPPLDTSSEPTSEGTMATPGDAPGCEESLVHLDNVRQVQRDVLDTQKAQQMAEFFATLSDPHRLKLLSALAQQELCVCDLAAIVKMGESAVSHQLRVLRSHRLVSYRRQGRNVYYRLADDHVVRLYREVAEHLDE